MAVRKCLNVSGDGIDDIVARNIDLDVIFVYSPTDEYQLKPLAKLLIKRGKPNVDGLYYSTFEKRECKIGEPMKQNYIYVVSRAFVGINRTANATQENGISVELNEELQQLRAIADTTPSSPIKIVINRG